MFLVRLNIIQCKKKHNSLDNRCKYTHYYSFSLKKSEFLNKLPHFAYKQIIFQGVHLSPLGFAACQSKKCTNRATIVFKSLFMRKICHISQQACNALSGSGLTAGR